jgi:hypothetical protein
MHRIPLVHYAISLTVVLFGSVPLLGSDPPIEAQVRHPVATLYPSEVQDRLVYAVKFDLRLTNRLDKPVSLPLPEKWDGETIGIAMEGIAMKLPFDMWKYIQAGLVLMQPSLVGDGKHKFEGCTSLQPGETREIRGAGDEMDVMKNRVGEVGSEPTVRLDLVMLCLGTDLKLVGSRARTNEFILRLPAEPVHR